MSSFRLIFLAVLLGTLAIAQSDRGTLTGTVADTSGAVIPNADVTAVNPATGVEIKTQTTDTGNYTIPSVPAGVYNLIVQVTGFRRFEQQGIRVQVAQTSRVDVKMEVGSTTESITVTADAALLRTESAAQATTVGRAQLNELPLNFAIGAGAVRNPLSFVQLSPGASISGWNTIRVNGAPSGTFKIIFEGQDSSSGLDARVSDESQPSVEALEEFTLQTSNFSAEFGQAGGGLFNFTARSGTNQFHGTVYDYFAHEKLYAGRPFTNNGTGGHIRPQVRRHNLGANLGGPVVIPKLYDGRNRTFFFVNYEMFRDEAVNFYGLGTVPTEAYRAGNFSAALTGRNLGTDGLGRAIMENTIYDPRTDRTGPDGRTYRDPFPGNIIPTNMLDPVALKTQGFIPTPINGSLVNNYELRSPYRKIQDIPSIKVDHSINDNAKFSVYYSRMRTDKDNGQDGLPDPISRRRDQPIRSNTVRINYDHTLRPTFLLHLGVGYQRYYNPDTVPPVALDFDPVAQLGLTGGFLGRLPAVQHPQQRPGRHGKRFRSSEPRPVPPGQADRHRQRHADPQQPHHQVRRRVEIRELHQPQHWRHGRNLQLCRGADRIACAPGSRSSGRQRRFPVCEFPVGRGQLAPAWRIRPTRSTGVRRCRSSCRTPGR